MEIEKIIRTERGVRITWTEDRDDIGFNTPEQIHELAAVLARAGRGCLTDNIRDLTFIAEEIPFDSAEDIDLLIALKDGVDDRRMYRKRFPGYPAEHFKKNDSQAP